MNSSTDSIQPAFTVLITTYNRLEELRLTLIRLKEQTFTDYEILIIDDASTDGTSEYLKGLCCDNNVRVAFRETRQGVTANRSLGMKLAHGKYIIGLDDDSCFTAPDAMERLRIFIERHPTVGCVRMHVIEGLTAPHASESTDEGWFFARSYIGCGHCLRQSLIEQIGGYRADYFYYGEESEYSCRILKAGYLIAYLPGIRVHHRISPLNRSLSRIWFYRTRNDILTAVLHFPILAMFGRVLYLLTLAVVQAIKFKYMHQLGHVFLDLIKMIPPCLKDRQPMERAVYRKYRILGYRKVTDVSVLEEPLSFGDILVHFRQTWWPAQWRQLRPNARSKAVTE